MTEPFALRPHQVRALDGLKASLRAGKRRPVVQLPTGAGKCLALGTGVMLFDGSVVPVEDIVAGDYLMGPDSQPRRVISTCRGMGELFRISSPKGDSWVCNDVHVLTLVNVTNDKIIDIPLDLYLTATKTFKWVHKQFSPPTGVDFPSRSDPDIDPYWLGLWVGDGTKALKGVAVSKPDREVYEACLEVAASHGLSVRTDGVEHGCASHHIHGGRSGPRENPLLTKLRNLFGQPAISFPHAIRTASREYRREFLAGIIDSDGYVAKGCVEIAQKNKSFADGIAFIARSLGLRVYMRAKIVNGTTYHRMGISGDFVGIETRIPRKAIAKRRQIKTATRTAFSVEPIGIGPYAGFELEGDGRFLLGDFTVTHNTILAAKIVSGALGKGNRVAFCVPALSLIDQTLERFAAAGINPGDMGVIQADHPWRRPHAPVQICSIQTISRRGFPIADVVIIDENHLQFEAVNEWIASEPTKVFVGLSATPWSKGMAKTWDDLIVSTSISELIADGFLSPFKVFAPSHPDLAGIKIVAGDYHEGQLSERMSAPKLVADVVENWIENGEDRPTLVFAVDRAHAAVLHKGFADVGIASAYVDANTSREDRKELADRFQRGEVRVICSVGTMTTGIDLDVRCVVFARPTKSEILFVQAIGRGLRIAPDKTDCLVFDHSDTTLRLGLVTDIHHGALLGGEKSKGESATPEKVQKLPTECQNCGCLVAPGAMQCSHCGHVAVRQSNVEHVAGELVEIGAKVKKARKDNREWTVDEKAAFFGELQGYALEKSYKSGWAANKYRSRFGVWPNDPRVKYVGARVPSPATRSWLRSQQIAWAKSKHSPMNGEAAHAG